MIKNKKNCRNKIINYLASCVSNEEQQKLIKTKFMNISAKTGQYNVPNELFQKRTPRVYCTQNLRQLRWRVQFLWLN